MTVAEEYALARASVVIPAHNEADVLSRCLTSLSRQPRIEECHVVVVANGCTDATAAVARRFEVAIPRMRVVELPQSGKIAALNAGDEVASAFPRIYLDADIELGDGALPGLIETLEADAPKVAAPSVSFDLRHSSWAVRGFYRVFAALPYMHEGLIGLGVYGVSRRGRERFDTFPDLIADDLFVQRCFGAEERCTSTGEFTVFAPRSLADLIKVRRRVSRGNAQLARTADAGAEGMDVQRTTTSTAEALGRYLASRPQHLGSVLVYLWVSLVARILARTGDDTWQRDESSRRPLEVVPDLVEREVESIEIDGIPVSALTGEDIVAHVIGALELDQGGIIMTPNVDHMQQLRSMPGRQQLVDSCELIVADGMPLVWASQLQGTPLPERVAGSDLVWALSVAAAKTGRSIFLLGGAPGVAERAATAFQELSPGLRVAGHAAPPAGFEQDPAEMSMLRRQLQETQPDIVFVALGFPRQERLSQQLADVLPHAWFLGCGGALDMASGDRGRAPRWAQAAGAEWAHRLLLEPRRLARRYLVNDAPYALGMLGRSAWRRRLQGLRR